MNRESMDKRINERSARGRVHHFVDHWVVSELPGRRIIIRRIRIIRITKEKEGYVTMMEEIWLKDELPDSPAPSAASSVVVTDPDSGARTTDDGEEVLGSGGEGAQVVGTRSPAAGT